MKLTYSPLFTVGTTDERIQSQSEAKAARLEAMRRLKEQESEPKASTSKKLPQESLDISPNRE
jgi:hypothetical protein